MLATHPPHPSDGPPVRVHLTAATLDAALQATADRRTDYRGTWTCECDAPLPWDAGKPIPGRCYCPPWRTEL